MQLNALKPGESALIEGIQAEQALVQRLHALGFRPGKQVQVVRQAAFNGPLHIRIGSTDVVIRLQDAQAIHLSNPSSESLSV
ncbi:MAG: ferrous iron transport protein A [Methylophilus sp.]|jgi:ferrous iron transport protein A